MADSQRKTANLFDLNTVVKGRIDNGNVGYASNTTSLTISSNGISCTTNYAYRGFSSDFIPISTSNLYIKYEATSSVYIVAVYYDSSKTWLNSDVSIPSQNKYASLTVPTGAAYIRFSFTFATAGNYAVSNIMLNTGSTPLPYEPYWQHSLRKLGTSTDTITTLPADVYADGNSATVGLKGQMVQSSTPSPTIPIQPQECGERTGNLFDKDSNTINNNGQIRPGVDVPAGIYSISNGTPNWVYYRVGVQGTTRQISARSNAENINASDTLYVWRDANIRQDGVMLNTGETALPYEPYGVKIPILSASTTTPVYLGEVETTRKIKKLVLDGTEAWNKGNYPPTGGYQFFTAMPADIATNSDWITTHFKNGIVLNGSVLNGSAFAIYLSLYPEASILPENATINDFKAWLAAQYAAGTPVCVWYVLATPETGIVNEPIRKIGNYADTVSGITIPTITGKDTFDVDTTLKPSEVSLSYTGWHDATVEEWDGSDWQ